MILDRYTTFAEVINVINSITPNSVKEQQHGGGHVGIRFVHSYFPISINEQEFNYMHDVIVSNNLKTGFELGTGTGVSTMSIGLAMKKTGGHLITLDSYYEEVTQKSIDIPEGTSVNQEQIKNVKGWQFVSIIMEKLNLRNTVRQCAGWSPTDSIRLLKNNQPLDFVFLDCPKSLNEIRRDVTYLKQFVNKDKFIIFIHDINDTDYRKMVNNMLMDLCGWELFYKEEYYVGSPYYKKIAYPIHFVNHNCKL